jgi:5-methylcytosine-specific restriction endonuclease McrA
MKKGTQRVMHCRCDRQRVLANGMCATCYTLRRQDETHFGGLREVVLERDGYCCRVCGASGRDKRSIIVHHRVPGRSVLKLMISLCPACHARIHKTRVVLSECRHSSWNYGESSTLLGISKPAWTLRRVAPPRKQCCSLRNNPDPVPALPRTDVGAAALNFLIYTTVKFRKAETSTLKKGDSAARVLRMTSKRCRVALRGSPC